MLRSPPERLIQSLLFETGGLIAIVPLYDALAGRSAQISLVLMLTISVTVLLWSPLHNAVFDHAERHFTHRKSGQRPHQLRMIHALSHELTPIIVTLPLIMQIGNHSLGDALAVNVGLTIFYVVYAYGFYLLYDHFRPTHGQQDRRPHGISR